MKMEFFEYLIAIEEYDSLNKAAKHLYISQPNLSQVIASFEKEIGYSVIYRNHQGIQFTQEGKQLLIIAHQIIRENELNEYALLHQLQLNLLKEVTCDLNIRENHPLLNKYFQLVKENFFEYISFVIFNYLSFTLSLSI